VNFTPARAQVTIRVAMGASRTLALLAAAGVAASGCADTLPDKISLSSTATNVEVLSEPPNPETYEPAGEVRAQVIGRETQAALGQAMNDLRNKAASRGATFVAVEDVTAHAAWDFSGRTVVTIVGTAYKTR
jgi:hypothetical protein